MASGTVSISLRVSRVEEDLVGGGGRDFEELEHEWKGGRGNAVEEQRGFWIQARQAKARPSNRVVQDLFLESKYTKAVLRFLKGSKVGCVKKNGATTRRG